MAVVTYELWRNGILVSTGLYSEEKPPSEGEQVTLFTARGVVKSVIPGLDGSFRVVVEADYFGG